MSISIFFRSLVICTSTVRRFSATPNISASSSRVCTSPGFPPRTFSRVLSTGVICIVSPAAVLSSPFPDYTLYREIPILTQCLFPGSPFQNIVNSQNKFFGFKRLGNIVIRTGFQPANPIGGLSHCRKQYDGNPIAAFPQPFQNSIPVTLGIIISTIRISNKYVLKAFGFRSIFAAETRNPCSLKYRCRRLRRRVSSSTTKICFWPPALRFPLFFFLAGAFLAACPVLAADFAFGADFAAVFRTGVLLFSAFSAETFFPLPKLAGKLLFLSGFRFT